MGHEDEQWFKDMHFVDELYQDWSKRTRSVSSPLSPDEWVGYLAIDYLIRMEAGYYDSLAQDDAPEPGRETLEALRALGLDRYANDLQRVYAKHADPDDREAALSELSSDFNGRLEFESAVVKYVRERAS